MRINKPTKLCNVCGSIQTKLIKISGYYDSYDEKSYTIKTNNEIDVCTNIERCWKAMSLDKIKTWIKKI